MNVRPRHVAPIRERSASDRSGRESPVPESDAMCWVLVNASGEMGFCSDPLAGLLRRRAADLKGLAVTSVLEDLPSLSSDTAGVYIEMMMMQRVGQPWPLDLILADGRRLAVFASVRSVQLGAGPAFVIELAPRGRPSALPPGGAV